MIFDPICKSVVFRLTIVFVREARPSSRDFDFPTSRVHVTKDF